MDRVDKIMLLQEQLASLANLRLNLRMEVPKNNNVGYDFVKLENVEHAINFPADKIKNSKGQNLTEVIKVLQDQWEKIIMDFKESFGIEVSKIYQTDVLPVGQN